MVGDQRVERARTIEHRRNTKTRRHVCRDVFHRVNRNVRLSGLHGDFEFLDEQPLATDFLQAAVEDVITARRHRHQLNGFDFGQFFQLPGDMAGLPEREFALAGGYTQLHLKSGSLETAANVGKMPTADYKVIWLPIRMLQADAGLSVRGFLQ